MPYPSNKDLPSNVDVLPDAAKTLFRITFNAILKDSGDEDKARRIAWTNVKRSYKKGEDGKWVAKSVAAISASPVARAILENVRGWDE